VETEELPQELRVEAVEKVVVATKMEEVVEY
jgi:hypothetical protein